jgi:hypothetical protein
VNTALHRLSFPILQGTLGEGLYTCFFSGTTMREGKIHEDEVHGFCTGTVTGATGVLGFSYCAVKKIPSDNIRTIPINAVAFCVLVVVI